MLDYFTTSLRNEFRAAGFLRLLRKSLGIMPGQPDNFIPPLCIKVVETACCLPDGPVISLKKRARTTSKVSRTKIRRQTTLRCSPGLCLEKWHSARETSNQRNQNWWEETQKEPSKGASLSTLGVFLYPASWPCDNAT